MERSRTIHWHDPLPGAKEAMKMSGIEYLQAVRDGKLPMPPLLNTLDFQVADLEKGMVTFAFEPQEFHYNPIGMVHGGVITAILDSAMGCSLHSLLEAGTAYTTIELKINFLKAVTIASGKLKAMGNVIHNGRRTALLEAYLVDDNNTKYAHGTSTCMVIRQ